MEATNNLYELCGRDSDLKTNDIGGISKLHKINGSNINNTESKIMQSNNEGGSIEDPEKYAI